MPAGDPPALLRLTTRETDGPLLEDGVAMVMLCGERPLDGVPDGGGGGLRRWSYGRGSERQKRGDCVVSYHHPLTLTRLPFTQRRRRSVERMAMRLMVLLLCWRRSSWRCSRPPVTRPGTPTS